MPLLGHHQPTPGQNNVPLELLPKHPRVIYSLFFITLGFLFLSTLRSVIVERRRRRRKCIARSGTLPTSSAVSVALNQQRLWLSEKSRGVSNNYIAMSANHPPEKPHPETELRPYPAHDATSDEDRSRVPSDDEGARDHAVPSTTRNVEGDGRGDSMYRPPPPPPLTPPTFTAGSFPFEDRRLSGAVSVVGDLDMSFFDQPNPDYTSSSDSSSTALDTKQTTPATPRRKSYTKMLPIGSPRVVTTDGELDYHHALSFSPSSFPSSSPILPLAPHASFDQPKEIDVKGEIISLTDDSGAGWKRHTRVYGGGVCLACMASGGQHGGFYGENVRPEDRR